VVDPSTGHERSRLAHDGAVWSVGFSPDGRWVVTGSGDRTARVFDPATGQERSRLAHDGPVWSVGFSPDGRWVVTGSADSTARVLPIAADLLVAALEIRMPRELTEAEWERCGGRPAAGA
jgi:WD40 repeat protein